MLVFDTLWIKQHPRLNRTHPFLYFLFLSWTSSPLIVFASTDVCRTNAIICCHNNRLYFGHYLLRYYKISGIIRPCLLTLFISRFCQRLVERLAERLTHLAGRTMYRVAIGPYGRKHKVIFLYEGNDYLLLSSISANDPNSLEEKKKKFHHYSCAPLLRC